MNIFITILITIILTFSCSYSCFDDSLRGEALVYIEDKKEYENSLRIDRGESDLHMRYFFVEKNNEKYKSLDDNLILNKWCKVYYKLKSDSHKRVILIVYDCYDTREDYYSELERIKAEREDQANQNQESDADRYRRHKIIKKYYSYGMGGVVIIMLTIIKDYKNLSLQDKINLRRIVAKRKSQSFANYIQARSLKMPYYKQRASQARHNHLFEKKLLQGL